MDRSDLANRMKEYEKAGQRYLTRRMPVLLRLDGCHFHSYVKKFKRPFDEVLIKTMQETTKYLCENIQGAALGYCQSDEITILLVDYKNLNSSAWFDNRQNKIESVAASMCTMAFNKFLSKNIEDCVFDTLNGANKTQKEYIETLREAEEKGAYFDCRAFNIPKEEVTNNFYWRQLDASRNSIQMVGQANFSHNELQNKSCNDIQDMLITQKGINWNDLPTYQKRGSCIVKEEYCVNQSGEETSDIKQDRSEIYTKRSRWIIDKNIPIFRCEDREYIERLVYVGE